MRLFSHLKLKRTSVLASVITDCLLSAECACIFNVLAFQFLHSLPVITWLFLCFTHIFQVIQLIQSVATYTLSITFVENKGLFTLYSITDKTVYFHFHGWVGKGFILFDYWHFWFVVLCGNWEAVDLAINNLLFQSETFLLMPSIDRNQKVFAFFFPYSVIVKHTDTVSDLVSRTNENSRYKRVPRTC